MSSEAPQPAAVAGEPTPQQPSADTADGRPARWGFSWTDWFWESIGRPRVMVRASGATAGGKHVDHVTYNCPRLSSANRMLVKHPGVLHAETRHCKYCTGDAGPSNPGPQDHLNALKERAAELQAGES